MTDDRDLNFQKIAIDCGITENSLDEEKVIEKFFALEEKFSSDKLVEIYKYFLKNIDNPKVLEAVISAQDKIRDKKILPELVDLLISKRDNPNFIAVRGMCAKAIANLKDTSAVNSLLFCLNNKSENYKVRFACADALGKIGDKFAVAPLINVVKDEDEKSVYLRESAATALGVLGDIRAIEPLVNILETKNGIIDKFTFLKERILEALGKLKSGDDKRVFNTLIQTLSDESARVRIGAIELLMQSENPKAYEVIRTCLYDKDEEVKKNALIALYNMRGRGILDEVIGANLYSDELKLEAVRLIDEYETNDNEEGTDYE